MFSQFKSGHHTCLKEDTLDQMLRIHVSGPPLSEWKADGALELLLKEKARRKIDYKEKHRKQINKFTSGHDTVAVRMIQKYSV